jgi:hypothetical protein
VRHSIKRGNFQQSVFAATTASLIAKGVISVTDGHIVVMHWRLCVPQICEMDYRRPVLFAGGLSSAKSGSSARGICP